MIGCMIHTVYTSAGLTTRHSAIFFFKPYPTQCIMTDTLCLINISPLYFRGFGFKPRVKSRKIQDEATVTYLIKLFRHFSGQMKESYECNRLWVRWRSTIVCAWHFASIQLQPWLLTFWSRNYFFNFSTPCI